MKAVCLNTQLDQFHEIQSEVKKKITKDYDSEESITKEFMRIIFL